VRLKYFDDFFSGAKKQNFFRAVFVVAGFAVALTSLSACLLIKCVASDSFLCRGVCGGRGGVGVRDCFLDKKFCGHQTLENDLLKSAGDVRTVRTMATSLTKTREYKFC
jgi:hypothetical protein